MKMLSKHLEMRVQSSEVRSMPGRFTWESWAGGRLCVCVATMLKVATRICIFYHHHVNFYSDQLHWTQNFYERGPKEYDLLCVS